MATPPELAALFQDALPAALARLRAIAESSDRGAALKALRLLERHLNDPRTIKLTQALGTADAALLHLDAINWCASARASLTTSSRSSPPRY